MVEGREDRERQGWEVSEFTNLFPDERVTLDFGRVLQQARMAKGLTQKELSTVPTQSMT